MAPHEFKVVMIGAVAVGKSSIANRLQFQIFEEDYQPTIGAGYFPYKTSYKDEEVELQIWDTAGMERYKSLGSIYFRDAKGCIIVYDQASLESADAIQSWLKTFRATVKTPCYIIIAGNKDDLPNKIVPPEKIKSWCDENGFEFFLTSSKTGKNITEMFDALVKGVMQLNTMEAIQTSPNLAESNRNEKGCC
ncbi:small GTP-binding protein [Tritrichomonas foetus]|uniref:Small GTP-binding protein n=1 Tax=Tritrichomonas foetus TaxID=1144522 RepID=A0A1J4JWN5_9EUKA|nr:small GTP-binding protein [Tritrichomonas foetus]|eukprot:OHT03561.1 small GTP-binding protein [Tritrichomonas foetus]